MPSSTARLRPAAMRLGWRNSASMIFRCAKQCGILCEPCDAIPPQSAETKGAGWCPAPWRFGVVRGSDRIVHHELDRVRGVLEIVHLFPFQLDVRLDLVA